MSVQDTPDTFEERFLRRPEIEAALPLEYHRQGLIEAARGGVIEVKSSEFGAAVANAEHDLRDPKRAALALQAYLDDVYRCQRLGAAPEALANVVINPGGTRSVNFNIDFN